MTIRIKLDFSDVSDRDGIWMLIDETFTTISDVEKHIVSTQRWLEGRNSISLFLKEYNLPSDESVLVLQSDDLVKVKYSRFMSDRRHTNTNIESSPNSLVPYSPSSSTCSSLHSTSSQVKPPSLALEQADLSSFPSSVNPSAIVSFTNKDRASASVNLTQDMNCSSRREQTFITDLTNSGDNPSRDDHDKIPASRNQSKSALESSFVSGGTAHWNIVPSGMEESPAESDGDLVDFGEYNNKDDENYVKVTGSIQEEAQEVETSSKILKDLPQPNHLVSETQVSELRLSQNCLEICEIDMGALEEAKKRRIDLIRKRLGVYGEFWVENKKYDDGCLYYEGGTPERMWLYPWTDGLDDLNHYIQVNSCQIKALRSFYLYFNRKWKLAS